MNEDLHIEKAARLADKAGAENLANDRARKFVARTLESTGVSAASFSRLFARWKRIPGTPGLGPWGPVLTWGGTALAVAACAAAFIIWRPFAPQRTLPGYGTPGQLFENQSIHAAADTLNSTVTDTLNSAAADTLDSADADTPGSAKTETSVDTLEIESIVYPAE